MASSQRAWDRKKLAPTLLAHEGHEALAIGVVRCARRPRQQATVLGRLRFQERGIVLVALAVRADQAARRVRGDDRDAVGLAEVEQRLVGLVVRPPLARFLLEGGLVDAAGQVVVEDGLGVALHELHRECHGTLLARQRLQQPQLVGRALCLAVELAERHEVGAPGQPDEGRERRCAPTVVVEGVGGLDGRCRRR